MGRGLAALSVVLLLAACGGSSGNGLVFVFQDSANDTDADKVVHVFCPSGKKALGGGYEITGQDPAFDYIATEGVNGNVATGDPPNG